MARCAAWRTRGWGWAVGLVLAAACLPCAANAQVAAGTRIDNVAALRWTMDGRDARATSNTVTLIAAERLDLTLVRTGATADAVSLRLTNTGNGAEAFAIAATAEGRTVRAVAIDRDGDGRFDPAVDTVLDGTTPVLAPGTSLPLLVVLDAGSGGSVTLDTRAATGSGAPGTAFAEQGDGGGDAVVGASGAAARVTVALPADGDAGDAPTLVKSQVVRAPDGTARAVSGAIVTYTLEARIPAAIRDARIEDPLPAGVAFVPGSLALDGTALTDADDADPGGFDGARVAVALGTIDPAAAGPVTRTVTFQVRLP